MSTVPASRRSPWARGGLYGLITALAPFTWVVEIDGCGQTAGAQTEFTGVALATRVDLEGWAVMLPLALFAVLTPFIAGKLTAGWSAIVQLLGLLATGFVAYATWFVLFFALFSERLLRDAGWVVAASLGLSLLEALWRSAWSAKEWWGGRRSAAAASLDA